MDFCWSMPETPSTVALHNIQITVTWRKFLYIWLIPLEALPDSTYGAVERFCLKKVLRQGDPLAISISVRLS